MNSQSGSVVDWTLLLPQLEGLFEVPWVPLTTWDISAAIILFMIVIFIIASCSLIWKFLKIWGSVQFILSILDETSSETLHQDRRTLREKIKSRKVVGDLWNEFDETLVEAHDGKAIFNTVDASHFFNTHTLASSVTESRLLSALPGIFTGLGVFGTFLGLQLGIGALDLSSSSAIVLQESIPGLIEGAAIAFSTSVWGVGASILFNLLEKYVERILRVRIHTLQNKIDLLVTRKNAEQTLIEIEHHNAESTDQLKGLAERIGDKMQEGIQKALGPATEQLINAANALAERQETGSERALESLVKRFSDSIGELGEEQRVAFEKTSTEVRDALSNWSASMGGVTQEFGEKLKSWSDIEDKRETSFLAQMEMLTEYQQSTTDKIDEILRGNTASAEGILQQAQSVNEQSRKTSESIDILSQKIADTADHMEKSTRNLENLSVAIRDAANTLSNAQTGAARSIESAAGEAAALTQSVGSFLQELAQMRTTLEKTADEIRQSAELANTTFSSLESSQAAFLESLDARTTAFAQEVNRMLDEYSESARTQTEERVNAITESVSRFGEQINEMLSDYSERVKGQTEERLNAWNEQTSAFSNTMVDAVSTIQDIVTELDDRLPRGRQ